ncbi:MAG: nucleotidyl transferase AbiEii/AbiGii toxin family protein [Clostridia bacterium]|nr:nucleotidyl transferase AbiEii/AbiGii toxin family protein [Clostridia bacterium]
MGCRDEQIKGRIRNIAKSEHCDARTLLRLYMMERFLERLAVSRHRDNFVIKGGVLVTAMVGISMRSTMDIDSTIKNFTLNSENAKEIIQEIAQIKLDDGVSFYVKSCSEIMDDSEYEGVRVSLEAVVGKVKVPIKIDISTGDVITPKEIKYQYDLMLENRSIELWSYNLETLLSEKIQTILSRGVLNTRTRDFYDIYILYKMNKAKINHEILKEALNSTCKYRKTEGIIEEANNIIKNIEHDAIMFHRWEDYKNKYEYSEEVEFPEVINTIKEIMKKIAVA